MSTILDVRNVNMSYFGGNVGVKTLSFVLSQNENLCFFGREFSGKSSVARVLCGLEQFEGEIFFKGTNIKDIRLKDRNFAYSFDRKSLKKRKNAKENILLPLKLRKIDEKIQKEKLEEICKILLITKDVLDTKIVKLNIKEQIKIVLARMFVINRAIYFVDNIFKELSVIDRAEIFELFRMLVKKTQSNVIYFTEKVEEITAFSSKCMILHKGKVVQEGNFDDIICNPTHLESAKLTNEEVEVFTLKKNGENYLLVSDGSETLTCAPIDEIYIDKSVIALNNQGVTQVNFYFDLASEYRISK